jgi:propanediol dehydratase large subunit
MQRLRVSADYLQTAAIVGSDWGIRSAINDPNDYTGPGTGYRLEGARWEKLRDVPHQTAPSMVATPNPVPLVEGELAQPGRHGNEVVIGVGPAFLGALTETIGGLSHEEVLNTIVEGIEEMGAGWRTVRVRRTSDVAFIAHDAARLSGSGIGVGIQSKGTTVIHRADLEPLDNLELFGMAPLLTLDSYRAIGRNAAAYALGGRPSPVPVEIDNYARTKLIVKTTLLHALETSKVEPNAPAVEFHLAGIGRGNA